MYQPNGEINKMKSQYELGMDYEFTRNLEISGEFAHINDRSLVKHNYNMIDIEVSFRF
jgi:hypothetical protein